MGIQIISISHKIAPLHVREMFAFTEEQQKHMMQEITEHLEVSECIVLSTCNRTEMYDAPRQALPPRVQPVRIHRRRDCRAAGRGGRPPQRAPEAQYGEPGPQGAPRPGPQCRGCVRRRPSRAACGAARPAGGRRVHHGQHDAFVRRGDSALGARVPHQHRRARRLAARSGREGVGCGNYFSTGRTFPQGRCRAETMLKHSFRQNIPRRGFEFSRLIATFGL